MIEHSSILPTPKNVYFNYDRTFLHFTHPQECLFNYDWTLVHFTHPQECLFNYDWTLLHFTHPPKNVYLIMIEHSSISPTPKNVCLIMIEHSSMSPTLTLVHVTHPNTPPCHPPMLIVSAGHELMAREIMATRTNTCSSWFLYSDSSSVWAADVISWSCFAVGSVTWSSSTVSSLVTMTMFLCNSRLVLITVSAFSFPGARNYLFIY